MNPNHPEAPIGPAIPCWGCGGKETVNGKPCRACGGSGLVPAWTQEVNR